MVCYCSVDKTTSVLHSPWFFPPPPPPPPFLKPPIYKINKQRWKEISPHLSSWRKVYSVSNWLRKRQWILFWSLSVFLISSKSLSFRSLACVETCSEREINSREILCITIPNGWENWSDPLMDLFKCFLKARLRNVPCLQGKSVGALLATGKTLIPCARRDLDLSYILRNDSDTVRNWLQRNPAGRCIWVLWTLRAGRAFLCNVMGLAQWSPHVTLLGWLSPKVVGFQYCRSCLGIQLLPF